MEAAVTRYLDDEDAMIADVAEWRIEHDQWRIEQTTDCIPDIDMLDDEPTRPVEVDVEAMRKSVGEIVVITR